MDKLNKLPQHQLIAKIHALEKDLSEQQKLSLIKDTMLRISELSYDEEINIEQFYEAVCKELNNIIDTTNFYIARLQNDDKELSFDFYQDTYGIQFEYEHDFPVRPYGAGLTEMVIEQGKTQLLSQADIEHIINDGTVSPRRLYAASWLGSPLTYNGKKLGAIVVQSYQQGYQFNGEDKYILNFVSQHVAAAIARYEQKRMLERNATTDPLTGLLNRAGFLKCVAQTIASQKKLNQSSLVFIDLDGFKLVNDNFGHDIGDELLIRVSQIICTVVREIDHVCRFGGDEFVILMNRLQEPNDVIRIAERLLDSLRQTLDINDKPIQIGASIGIAYGKSEYKEGSEFLKDADTAMYVAKRNGKFQYAIAN